MTLGIRGLAKHGIIVPANNFINLSINLFHEAQHVRQHYQAQMETIDSDPSVILSRISILNNENIYKRTYPSNLIELDAEFNGTFQAHRFLTENFSAATADKFVLKYINDLHHKDPTAKTHSVPITEFHDMAEVEDAFQQAYLQYKTQPHKLISYPYDHVRTARSIDELYYATKDKNVPEHIRQQWRPILDQLNVALSQSAERHDRLLACIMTHIHPEYKDLFPIMRREELNPQYLFGTELPLVTQRYEWADSAHQRQTTLSRPDAMSPKYVAPHTADHMKTTGSRSFADQVDDMSDLHLDTDPSMNPDCPY